MVISHLLEQRMVPHNQIKVLLLVLVSLFMFSVQAAGPLKFFVERLSSQCQELNILLVKKSMIELHHEEGKSCTQRFTKALLVKCPSINCKDIQNFYTGSMKVKRGSIIGERRRR